ncbi:Serine/threonine protein kinase [Handroanthus impetiginosus]|uniref:Serine/threonine protein kinase n=1 Tax=Handroanthus impetiginosus TaxID=429701 RepID=A0A2G9HBU2_9LAMI|nr:Serine/threonine protein kinase [Handroanthus impetiginosus]
MLQLDYLAKAGLHSYPIRVNSSSRWEKSSEKYEVQKRRQKDSYRVDRMNLAKCLILFSLFHYLIIYSADSKCQKSFRCGNLGFLEFPLSHVTKPECGLFPVNCSFSYPRIQLGDGGTWYDVLVKLSANKIRIRDPNLDEYWYNYSCSSFRGLSLPSSPSSSLTISSPNITMFECPKDSLGESNALLDNYFGAENYTVLDRCPRFILYYSRYQANISFREEFAIPEPCSVVQLPGNLYSFQGWKPGDALILNLTSEFDLEWNLSDACLKCHQEGGQCKTMDVNKFLCTQEQGKRKLKRVLLTVGVTVTAFLATSIILFILFWKNRISVPNWLTLRKAKTGNTKDIELFLKGQGNLAQKRYKYSDIKKMTNSFSENLGKGGYGSVYKGKLPDGRLVAVKILNETKENGEEFMNEVSSISRTSHINIVTLLGFCFEDSKRALIYEFMPNGSLEKFINAHASSSAEHRLGQEKLFQIAVGVAQGLDYLHRGCNTRILHFDIKPHNILLDNNFNPKISDFGLARLCPNRSSVVSILAAGGTAGYIAPEVFCRSFGEVSHKSDVYSYGMVLLDMVFGRQKIDPSGDHSSETNFPDWIYERLEVMNTDRIPNEDECELARKMIIVGLWCIQTEPKNRPPVSQVVEMLGGSIEFLQIPPKPFLFLAPTPAVYAASASEPSKSQLIPSSSQ